MEKWKDTMEDFKAENTKERMKIEEVLKIVYLSNGVYETKDKRVTKKYY